ncbi:MAG: YifB family Mg chelatase-like AAA ATPase [Gammaproteobacteria bacterium]|nr:YifB family Mg chelatase-like AAA ATPase [Gammaproteobacteria bacterium]
MDTAVIRSRAAVGVEAPEVTVEVHLSNGLPALALVGLAETAIKESRDRVRSALLNTHFEFPQRRITIGLAPADLPKDGARFDLPIALGILAASGQIQNIRLDAHEFVGELALTGALRPVRGVLPVAIEAARAGHALIVPTGNAEEAALVRDARVLPAARLTDVTAYLNGADCLQPWCAQASVAERPLADDLTQVRAQHAARRALEIAAAGTHNLLFIGPPGTGKTMLAVRLPGILPPLTETQAMETAAVRSIAGESVAALSWRQPPFRAPHHSASAAALVGGGNHPRPGEISLAHNGVLFLDELPEFDRRVLEALREPLEAGQLTVSRAARHATFPARVLLVAAMNPCPCGHRGSTRIACRCSPELIARYRGRISGPLLDRIDMHVEVPPVPHAELLGDDTAAESSAAVRTRVSAARARQIERQGRPNAVLDATGTEQYCALTRSDRHLLIQAVERLGLSARAVQRVRRVARTIADLAGAGRIETPHLAEALGYRRLDRAYFG